VIPSVEKLRPRTLLLLFAWTCLVTLLVATGTPWLLVLSADVALTTTRVLTWSLLSGGSLGMLIAGLELRRHRYLLRNLVLGTTAIDPLELEELASADARLTFSWLVPSSASLMVFFIALRPTAIDPDTAASAATLGILLCSGAALPLLAAMRSLIAAALEHAPPAPMREVLERARLSGAGDLRTRGRFMVAVLLPAVLVAAGGGLVASAHLRRSDELEREETARALARAVLEPKPGLVVGAGLEDALAEASSLGYNASVASTSESYRLRFEKDGRVELQAPLDDGSASVTFRRSVVGILEPEVGAIVLIVALGAAMLGLLSSSALLDDLAAAVRGIGLLDTERIVSGSEGPWRRSARFRAVGRLIAAIDRLSQRFRHFAHAQERAIQARESATRMRGQFFASVSHDLKSPLNAILGFTELVRHLERLTPGQLESLEVVQSRGRELLALIETILDAARVEAGQLEIVPEPTAAALVLRDAIDKGRDLAAGRRFRVTTEIAEGVTPLRVDRLRFARALATFIGHGARVREDGELHLRVLPSPGAGNVLEVEVPRDTYDTRRMLALMTPKHVPAKSERRGLALALHLAQTVIELHGGALYLEDRPGNVLAFIVTLPDPTLASGPPTAPPSAPEASSARRSGAPRG